MSKRKRLIANVQYGKFANMTKPTLKVGYKRLMAMTDAEIRELLSKDKKEAQDEHGRHEES